jgi:hypothetical protein
MGGSRQRRHGEAEFWEFLRLRIHGNTLAYTQNGNLICQGLEWLEESLCVGSQARYNLSKPVAIVICNMLY